MTRAILRIVLIGAVIYFGVTWVLAPYTAMIREQEQEDARPVVIDPALAAERDAVLARERNR
jgi:hypothetical protein